MPAPRRFLGQQAQTVETRAAAMQKPLEAWLRRFALWARTRAIRNLELEQPVDFGFEKAAPPDLADLTEQLRALLTRYGLQQMQDAVARGAATIGAEVSLTDALIADFFASKDIKVKEIMEATLRASQDAIRGIISEALAEEVRPSTTEIGRRLRNRLNFGTTEAGQSFAFTPERAQLIARTEMVQAQNTGIVQGYRLSGITHHRWVAYNDGRTGDRRHNEMNRHPPVAVDEFFTLPDGTKIRYPGDPDAPIKHTANCRCTTVPVISPGEVAR